MAEDKSTEKILELMKRSDHIRNIGVCAHIDRILRYS